MRPPAAFGKSSDRIRAWARHAICVLALMWTGLVNGQPFMFQSDTTNYVRAADAAMFVISGGAIHTEWTDRYRAQIEEKAAKSSPAARIAAKKEAKPAAGANDLGNGLIMSGRSPYIGGLMYAGYLLGDFWPFVFVQALIAYLLIILTMKRFGVYTARDATILTLALSAATALPTYNSLLLADALAGFGILSFLLLATPGKLSRWEQVFLGAVLITSVVSHLTHIMMLIGMVAALALLVWTRLTTMPPRRAWLVGLGGIAIGFASVQATSLATKLAFGREPQLLPLLTARFIADGPGRDYLRSGCDGKRFEICKVHIGNPYSDSLILFGRNWNDGAYMLVSTDQRRAMGEQDIAFALAVLKYDPIGQISAMARNTVRQLAYIDYDGLNQNCFDDPRCWEALPTKLRDRLRATPSGQGEWPQGLMNALLYVAVIASFAVLAITSPGIARGDPERWRSLRTWLLVGFAAMLVCAFFGGAVAEPQYRYQGRLIWLVPLAAGIAFLIRSQIRREQLAPLRSGEALAG